ncbi:biotin carboxylase N-terminal domain-containing protein [Nocardia sp. NPDC020380]|uniref:biotin carboxylase N-terminal domain-containing protein n=1 Tax=Nocardia sp. NPDC020380 TaxID=3364309 RepID=UPI0037B1C9DE
MRKLLIANRGAIATRAIDSARALGLSPIAVAARSDPQTSHTRTADGCEYLDGDGLAETYDNPGQIVAAAQRCGADAVYPGYGALAEDPELAHRLAAAGIGYIGPTAEVLAQARDKEHAVATAERLGIPVLPHAAGRTAITRLVAEIGAPVIVKPTDGCGGQGVQIAHTTAAAEQILAALPGENGWYAERYVQAGQVVGVTVAVDDTGTVLELGERESLLVTGSMKLLEATPVLGVAPELLARMRQDTARLVTGIGLRNIATVEFIVGPHGYYFLELNGRLPLAFRMCETQTGADLIALQLELARGRSFTPGEITVDPAVHCLEARMFLRPGHTGSLRTLELFPEPGAVYNCALDRARPITLDNIITQVLAAGADRVTVARTILRALEASDVTGIDHCGPEIVSWLRASDPARADLIDHHVLGV